MSRYRSVAQQCSTEQLLLAFEEIEAWETVGSLPMNTFLRDLGDQTGLISRNADKTAYDDYTTVPAMVLDAVAHEVWRELAVRFMPKKSSSTA